MMRPLFSGPFTREFLSVQFRCAMRCVLENLTIPIFVFLSIVSLPRVQS